MRNRFRGLSAVLSYIGALFWIFGFVLLVPLLLLPFSGELSECPRCILAFVIPSGLCFLLGAVLKRTLHMEAISGRGAMLVCGLGWILISAVGALPYVIRTGMGFLDAYFETVSGFTTTGTTVIIGLDLWPGTLLLWRSFTQWVGGLGILTFFLAISYSGGYAHRLFSAESHKFTSKRITPGMFHTLKILWAIYGFYTVLVAGLLVIEGMPVFDSIIHAMTALSTGGFSNHDLSVAYYASEGFRFAPLIEYTFIFGMLLGGLNFLIHYRLLRGDGRSLFDNFETRLYWGIIGVSTLLVMASHFQAFGPRGIEGVFRKSLFQVVAMITTTGYGTQDIGSPYFPALAKQVFLALMVVGGCVGSTGGGIKVLRVGILYRMLKRQLGRVIMPGRAVNLVTVDGVVVDQEEIRRVATLFFAWMILILAGGLVTSAFSSLGPLESLSGMFSAMGNIGPSYIPILDMAHANPAVKITYIFGMLAGRLEILPVLILFQRRAWT
jgi:trk system potassium uptake protein TrkH